MNKNVEHVAMAIVNYTNDRVGTGVYTRQANNDNCFDYAVAKINECIPLISSIDISSSLVRAMQNYRHRLQGDILVLNSNIRNYGSCAGYPDLLERAEVAKRELAETKCDLRAVERFLEETAFNLGDKVAVKDTTVFSGLRKGQLGNIVEIGKELNIANQKIKIYTIEFEDGYQQNTTEDFIHDCLIKVIKED